MWRRLTRTGTALRRCLYLVPPRALFEGRGCRHSKFRTQEAAMSCLFLLLQRLQGHPVACENHSAMLLQEAEARMLDADIRPYKHLDVGVSRR